MSSIATRCPNHRDRPAVKRGLCITCYDTAYARVRRGLVTWKELEKEGVVKPQGERGRPRKVLRPVK